MPFQTVKPMIVGIAHVVEAAHLGGLEIPIAINKPLMGPLSGLNKAIHTTAIATRDATYGKNNTERKNTRPFNGLFIKIAKNKDNAIVTGTVTIV